MIRKARSNFITAALGMLLLAIMYTTGASIAAEESLGGCGYGGGQREAGEVEQSQGEEQSKSVKYVPAKHIEVIRPAYPAEARENRWQGKVTLRMMVLADGAVADVAVVDSSGYEVLDNAAIEAVQQWRYMPARENNEAISQGVAVCIKFELVDDLPPVEIYKIQQKLNDLGFDCGEPDGKMNDCTKIAVKNFQRLKGLEPNGIVDAKTSEALERESVEGQ